MAEKDSCARRVPAPWQDDNDGSLNCGATTVSKVTLECSGKAVTVTVSSLGAGLISPCCSSSSPCIALHGHGSAGAGPVMLAKHPIDD